MRRGSYDDASVSIRPHLRSLAQRRRSAPSLAFGRALGIPWNLIREEAAVAVEQCPFVLGLSGDSSPLALDECVQLTEGQKTRERHLFLFSQELVIAKLKSSASYRLKHRLSLEELWLYPCEDDNEEEEEEPMDFELKTSLVLVWPLGFCVVTFRSPEVKERWVETLHRKITEVLGARSGSSSPPLDILMKVLSGSSIMTKTLTEGGTEENRDGPPEGNDKVSASQRPLYNKEESEKQPIGHTGNQGGKLSFITRKLKRSSIHNASSSRSDSRSSSILFGQPLSKICLDDGSLPKPITEILQLLRKKGPATEGVFRKAGNSRNLTTIREQLNTGAKVDMEALPVVQLVGLLKSFLKELPGCLLVAERYDQWISAVEKEDEHQRLTEIKSVIESVPEPNILLLQHLLCMLHHISQSSHVNKMDASNLAVCISPSLLHQTGSQTTQDAFMQSEEVKKVTGLTQFLIENCCSVFGEDVLTLLGDPDEELADNLDSMSSHQHDSAYDSTDPDADGDPREASPVDRCTVRPCKPDAMATHRTEHSIVASCSSDAIFTTFTNPFSRRCSEPAIFPSAACCSRAMQGLARSHDDFSAHSEDFQELKKQTSEDFFLLSRQAERRLAQPSLGKLSGSLTMDLSLRPSDRASTASKDCSCSSSCSLESAASNISEGSVFASSPLSSPASLRRSHSTKYQEVSSRSQSVTSKPPSKSEQPKAQGEVKRRTQSMRVKGLGSLFGRATMKPGEPQKEPAFPCGPLHEDSQSEAETPEGPNPPGEPLRPRRPLSAIEVFQHVDSQHPCSPPSYTQALLNSSHCAPPQYPLTVQAARDRGRRARPFSMNEDFLLNSPCHVNRFTDCFQTRPEPGDPSVSEPTTAFRARAMSESVSRSRQDTVARRCSQPLFEEISYAKESYV